MFERFTDRARRIIVLAQEEARVLGSSRIGTEHLMLGLITEGAGVAIKALESLGVSLDEVRGLIEAEVRREEQIHAGEHIPFNPDARKALEMALREALALHHNYIGTEHILLGLMQQGAPTETKGESVVVKALTQFGAPYADVLEKVRQLLGDDESSETGPADRRETVPFEDYHGRPQPNPELVRRAINAIVRARDEQLEEVLRLLEGE